MDKKKILAIGGSALLLQDQLNKIGQDVEVVDNIQDDLKYRMRKVPKLVATIAPQFALRTKKQKKDKGPRGSSYFNKKKNN